MSQATPPTMPAGAPDDPKRSGAAATPPAAGSSGPAGAAAPAAPTSSGGMPAISELKGRPIGRVLTKMGKVTREQVVEALTFQKSKGGALGRILVDLGYVQETDLNV